jgi:hypothetical protein
VTAYLRIAPVAIRNKLVLIVMAQSFDHRTASVVVLHAHL